MQNELIAIGTIYICNIYIMLYIAIMLYCIGDILIPYSLCIKYLQFTQS